MLGLVVYLRGSAFSTLDSFLAAGVCFKYRAYSSKFSRASVYAAKKSVLPTKDISAQASADVRRIPDDIKTVLKSCNKRVSDITQYAFGSQGKMLRPLLVLLMAACANAHEYCRPLANRTKQNKVHFYERQLGNLSSLFDFYLRYEGHLQSTCDCGYL
uniref:Decaprenyl-diphosphate synthase subunit 1 n=1 Tax=Schistocephalus solidus TaxID=70667 RepID=A0A0X3P7U4_SCHSO